ncbi:hypothetical protein ACKVMT_01500 [Halobacteriales archaeon Cl-PHB]
MSTTGRPERSPADSVAAACRDAGLVRLVAAPDGDALAAMGVLGRAFAATDLAFQASVVATPDHDPGATDADCTVALGRPDVTADHALLADAAGAVSQQAYAVTSDLGDADPVLALAGAIAADRPATGQVHEDATASGVERRPGVAVPTDDVADGLAHSTLVHGPLSGDREAAEAALADLDSADDAERGRRVASLAALSVTGAADATPRAAEAVERICRPYVGGPFATVGGYADVLDALAVSQPGLGIALALGRADADDALAAWRDHAAAAHDGVREATVQRHDGLVVCRDVDGPLATVARLVRDFRSPEPVVLAGNGDDVVATTADETVDLAAVFADAGETTGAATGDTGATVRASVDDADAFVTAVREALG